jgi:hypothetical protein
MPQCTAGVLMAAGRWRAQMTTSNCDQNGMCDGSSPSRAIVMTDGVKPYTLVEEQHGPCTLLFQRLMHHAGRMLDAMTVVDASGSVRHVYFDVSDLVETHARLHPESARRPS